MRHATTPARRCATALVVALVVATFFPVGASAVTAEAAPRATVKAPLSGLLDRDGPPPKGLRKLVHSYVVNVKWKSLQPSPDSLTTGGLDRALRVAKNRNSRVKLRIMAGIHSPDWAKQLGGSPVRLTDPHDNQTGDVPRFWTAAFGAAYADLQERLAARYDDRNVVAEVVVSRCSTFYAEPFVRQTSHAGNRKALLAAGYTRDADKTCHRQQITAHRVWKRTRSGLAFNPAQFVTASGGRTVDDRFTAAMMRHCRDELGKRCILENNSIRSPIASLDPNPKRPHYQRMYRAMVRHSPARAFQTATAARMGKCAKTLGWAVEKKAHYVELPWDVTEVCSKKVLASAARKLG